MNRALQDSGVSEIVGALMLIALIALGISIAGVYLVDKTNHEKIPEFRASIANTSTNLTLHHDGGDPIPRSNLEILVNGNPTHYVSSQNQSSDWSIDDTLTLNYPYNETSPLPDVKIVYTGTAGSRVLSDFSSYMPQTTVPTITTTVTTTPSHCIPTASFTYFPSNPDTSNLILFTDTSTCSPTSWSWTSSDGWTATTKNPTHTFTTAGTYTVTLTSSNMYGASAPFSRTITVTSYIPPSPPVADFSANITTGCSPHDIQFDDASSFIV